MTIDDRRLTCRRFSTSSCRSSWSSASAMPPSARGLFRARRGRRADEVHAELRRALPALPRRSRTLDLRRGVRARAAALSFYTGACAGFVAGLLGARLLFRRRLGRCRRHRLRLPLLELAAARPADHRTRLRARCAGRRTSRSSSIHAPFCYGFGITAMEIVRSRGRASRRGTGAARSCARSSATRWSSASRRALSSTSPGCRCPARSSTRRYDGPGGDPGGAVRRWAACSCATGSRATCATIAMVCAVSLILHPAVIWALGRCDVGLDTDALRSAVLTAAMAPGVNAYIFAAMYGVAMRVAASAVLIATALSVVTAWGWLHLLP